MRNEIVVQALPGELDQDEAATIALASDSFDAWDELTTGTTGDDALVGVRVALRLYPPNRRIVPVGPVVCEVGGCEAPPYLDYANESQAGVLGVIMRQSYGTMERL